MLNYQRVYILVGGFKPSEKYESMGRIIPYIMEHKKCLKPPTSVYIYIPIYGISYWYVWCKGIDIHENSNEYHSYIIMNHNYIPSAGAKPVSWCYLHRDILITTINPTVDPRELWLKKPGNINIRPKLWNKNGESWIFWECMEMYGNVLRFLWGKHSVGRFWPIQVEIYIHHKSNSHCNYVQASKNSFFGYAIYPFSDLFSTKYPKLSW